jgi:hypothetical protein
VADQGELGQVGVDLHGLVGRRKEIGK